MSKLQQKISTIIAKGESETVEFKSAQKGIPNSMFETICSFLNRNGGIILLGIDDDKKISGINSEKTEGYCKEIVSLSNNPQKLTPTFLLNADIIEYQNKQLIYVHVPPSSQVHKCNGKIYDRSADGDFIISSDEQIKQMYLRKSSFYTESTIYPYLDVKHFVPGLVKKTRNIIKDNRFNHPWSELDDRDFFVSSGLYRYDLSTNQEGFTLAALLLFGKEEHIISAIPHYKTDIVVIKDDINRYEDRLTLRCNLIDSVDALMGFVEKYLPDKFYLEGIRRISLRDIIFREIIVNMLIHREFTNAFPATIFIRRDFVEIKNANKTHNYGSLFPGNFEPFPKNPNIAKMFTQLGFSEELGTGIKKVYQYIEDYTGKTNVEFIEKDIFSVKVPLPSPINTDKTPINTDKMLINNEDKIIEYLNNEVYVTNSIAQKITGLSANGIKSLFKRLVIKEILEKVGDKKQTKYKLMGKRDKG
jgi:ATP-dependent DNA helicase RecG